MVVIRKMWILLGLLIVVAISAASLRTEIADRDIYVPSTISPEAQQHLRVLQETKPYTREFPGADASLKVWRKAQDAIDAAMVAGSEKAIADNKVTVAEATLGGVPVLDIRHENWTDNGKLLVYTHGGGYFSNKPYKRDYESRGHRFESCRVRH